MPPKDREFLINLLAVLFSVFALGAGVGGAIVRTQLGAW